MDYIFKHIFIIISISHCNSVSLREQLEHVAKRRQESLGMPYETFPTRRFKSEGDVSTILGAPSMASHLPEAEPILPGHTLLRPALGMLKSAIKFPHKDLENGAGVYGNIDNLGIRYDGRNERLLYSGFRRSPADYIMVVPVKPKDLESNKPKFLVSSVVLDLDKNTDVSTQIWRALNKYAYNQRKKPKNYYWNDDTSKMGLRDGRTTDPFEDDKKFHSSTEGEERDKKTWFWSTKDAYNNIKFNHAAYDHDDFLPFNETEKLRHWWFFHQDDFQPFRN